MSEERTEEWSVICIQQKFFEKMAELNFKEYISTPLTKEEWGVCVCVCVCVCMCVCVFWARLPGYMARQKENLCQGAYM